MWLFDEDDSGHMWYGEQREGGNYKGNIPFTWESRTDSWSLMTSNQPRYRSTHLLAYVSNPSTVDLQARALDGTGVTRRIPDEDA